MRDLTGWRVGEGAFSLRNKVLYCFACVRTTLDVFRVCVRARVHVRVCVCVSTRICLHVSVYKWSKLLLLLYPISLKLPVCFCLVLFCYYCSSLVTSSRKKIINKPEIQAERERENPGFLFVFPPCPVRVLPSSRCLVQRGSLGFGISHLPTCVNTHLTAIFNGFWTSRWCKEIAIKPQHAENDCIIQ